MVAISHTLRWAIGISIYLLDTQRYLIPKETIGHDELVVAETVNDASRASLLTPSVYHHGSCLNVENTGFGLEGSESICPTMAEGV